MARRAIREKSSNEYKRAVSACQGGQTCCTLCNEHLKGVHSHFGQWKLELQHFLQQYSAVLLESCVCRVDNLSIKTGFD